MLSWIKEKIFPTIAYSASWLKEKILAAIGYPKESKIRKFLDKRANYLTQDLTAEANAGKGHATVVFPRALSFIMRTPVRQMTVITDPNLAKEIQKQLQLRTEDPNARVPFKAFDAIFNTNHQVKTQK